MILFRHQRRFPTQAHATMENTIMTKPTHTCLSVFREGTNKFGSGSTSTRSLAKQIALTTPLIQPKKEKRLPDSGATSTTGYSSDSLAIYPQAGDDLTIPYAWRLVYDLDPATDTIPVFNELIIDGILTFEPS